jgi:hypothetical protein
MQAYVWAAWVIRKQVAVTLPVNETPPRRVKVEDG